MESNHHIDILNAYAKRQPLFGAIAQRANWIIGCAAAMFGIAFTTLVIILHG